MAQMPNQQVQQMDSAKTTVSIGNWIGTVILTAIPILGLILLFVWAFSSTTIPSKKNWARATLILSAIAIVLSVIGSLIFGSFFNSFFAGIYY